MCKAGFARDKTLHSVFPSILGRLIYVKAVAGRQNKHTSVGDEACPNAGILFLKHQLG
jgi:actin-related protein